MKDPLQTIFFDHEFDGSHWKALRESLVTQIAVLPACEMFPSVKFPNPSQKDEILAARKQIFQSFSDGATEEAARSVFVYTRESEWPELSPQAIFFLTIFLDQAEDFLGLCYVDYGDRVVSLFPYSHQPLETLYQWLVFRWWFGPGLRRWIGRVLEDRSMFDKYFSSPE